LCVPKINGKGAMKRGLLIIGSGMLAAGTVFWAVWGNPENAPRMHTVQEMKAAPELRLVSERSPYMRTER
jgi:hypothetical protein